MAHSEYEKANNTVTPQRAQLKIAELQLQVDALKQQADYERNAMAPRPSLRIQLSTSPGEQAELELCLFGAIDGAGVNPDDLRAVRITLPVGATSYIVYGELIDLAFPGTDYVCVTARKKGTEAWWTHPDQSYTCVPWPNIPEEPVVIPEPPVVIPPDPVRADVIKALDLAIKKKTTLAKTLVILRDALKKGLPK